MTQHIKMEARNGWRFYKCRILCDGEIGINRLGQAKWYPNPDRINSTWISRDDAARTIRLERNFANASSINGALIRSA